METQYKQRQKQKVGEVEAAEERRQHAKAKKTSDWIYTSKESEAHAERRRK